MTIFELIDLQKNERFAEWLEAEGLNAVTESVKKIHYVTTENRLKCLHYLSQLDTLKNHESIMSKLLETFTSRAIDVLMYFEQRPTNPTFEKYVSEFLIKPVMTDFWSFTTAKRLLPYVLKSDKWRRYLSDIHQSSLEKTVKSLDEDVEVFKEAISLIEENKIDSMTYEVDTPRLETFLTQVKTLEEQKKSVKIDVIFELKRELVKRAYDLMKDEFTISDQIKKLLSESDRPYFVFGLFLHSLAFHSDLDITAKLHILQSRYRGRLYPIKFDLVDLNHKRIASKMYLEKTAPILAAIYSKEPFSQLKIRLSKHVLDMAALGYTIISAGAYLSEDRLRHIYNAIKNTRWISEEESLELFKSALSERAERGFKPLKLPFDLSQKLFELTLNKTESATKKNKIL